MVKFSQLNDPLSLHKTNLGGQLPQKPDVENRNKRQTKTHFFCDARPADISKITSKKRKYLVTQKYLVSKNIIKQDSSKSN